MKLKEFTLFHLLMAFDATSLYHSAMYDEKSVYPIIETGHIFTSDMEHDLLNEFNSQTFKSVILKIKYYNPKDRKLQHEIKKRFKTELNRLRNGYNVNTLTSVDIQKIVKVGVKLLKFMKV